MAKYYGVDALGMAKYKKVMIDEFRDCLALGSFQQVDGFGNSIPVAVAMLTKYQIPVYRMNAQWRDNHDYSNRQAQALKRARAYVEKIVLPFPQTKHYFSPYTEYCNLSKEFLVDTYTKLRQVLPPHVTIVFNPQDTSHQYLTEEMGYKNVAVELHHVHYKKVSKRMIYSDDGHDYTDTDINKRKQQTADAEIHFVWGARNNGRASMKAEDYLPRPQRQKWVTAKEMRAQVFLAQFERGRVKWDDSFGLWKAYAEFKTNASAVDKAREGKPVFLIKRAKYAKQPTRVEFKKKGKTIEVIKIDSTNPYNSDEKSWVFRSDLWGYEISQKSVEITDVDSHTLNVWINGKSTGLVVAPAYRSSNFR